MGYNVKPGDKATVIGSVLGPSGPSVGRRVMVHADIPVGNPEFDNAYSEQMNALNDPKHYCPPSPYEKEHTEWGKIWPCTAIDGKGPFVNSKTGELQSWIAIPDRFLQKDPPAEQMPRVREATLEKS